ncbi:MAG: hypothetical protein DHS20C17_33450 [Cyclobacteriaceae bacterium]|nr:MAG: hypothetical protein DHS20C17_33450 [Cyclobacteriaceae bacterium]
MSLITTHLIDQAGCNVLHYFLNGPGGTVSNTTGEFVIYFPGNYTVSLLQIEDGITSWIDSKNITITMPDTRPPYMKCKDINVSLTGSARVITNFEDRLDDGSTDNCGIVSLSPSNNFFTCSSIGQQIVTLTGTDAAGNTATCISTVTVYDSGAPVPDVTNLPTLTNACSVTVSTIPTATDNCEEGTFIATTDSPLTFTEQGTYNITWTYQDSKGNTSTQNQTVIIDDQSTPVVSCPSDIIVDADANACTAIVNYAGSAVDNCETPVEAVTYTGNSSTVPAGDDRLLLVQVCHFDDISSVTYDGNAMSLAIKQDANVSGTCEIWYLPLGSGSAISSTAQVTGVGFPNLVRYITFEHVNQSAPFGDMAQGTRKNILEVSTQLKDMIYEGFMRKDGNSINPQSGQTEVFDNSFNSSSSRCWGAYKAASGGIESVGVSTNNGAHVALVLQANHTTQFSYSIDPGSTFQIGTRQVTFTATDKGNNSSSCTFNVTVNDMTPPTVSCPNDISINADAGLCTALVEYSITSTDNCGNEEIGLTTGLPSGAEFPVGVTTNTLVVTDANGLTASCSFQVTVNDIVPPVANCKNATLQLGTGGNASITNADIDDGSTDNCNTIASLELDQTDFNCSNVGSNTVILTATDSYNNSSTCAATVIVVDNVSPTAQCQDQTVQLDNNGNGSVTGGEIDDDSSDACGIASLSLNVSSFTCANIGDNQVILTVLDIHGNANTCEATVFVEDNVAPTAICQDQTVQLDANGNTTTSINEINNGSNDACGLANLTLNKTSFICTDVGNQTVILTAMDNNGNSNTCEATIVVQDPIVPTANCNNLTINLPDQNTYNLSSAEIEAIALGSNDNCDWTPSISSGATSYSCNDRDMDFTLTLTVTDVANNSSSCQAIISIRNPNNICNDSPMAVCQNLTVPANDNCEAIVNATDLDGGSSDPDLDPLTFSMDHSSSFGLGTYTVTLTVSDGEFTSSCSATVMVEDVTAPMISCPGDLSLNTDPENCSSTFTVPVPLASDNCEVSVLRYRYRLVDESGNNISGEDWSSWSTSTTETLGTGNWKMQWQAKDPSGNQVKCAFYVEVTDQEAPQPACFNPTVEFNGEASINLAIESLWNEGASSDNCGDVFLVDQSILQVTCDQINSVVPVEITVEDANGNTASCTANVDVAGLPCGWSVDPIGIGCEPATGNYDPDRHTFELASESCYDPSYYRQNDQQGFIQKDFCGDGEIIAEINEVLGNGWAGISMRESNDPSAPMIQLLISNSNSTRREARMSNGAPAYAHVFQTQGKNWLRLSRSGNLFSAYHSMDGSNWSTVFSTQIAMSTCIYVGMITMNSSSSGEVTGVYENVSVSGVSALVAPITVDFAQETRPDFDFSLYPNPTSDEVTLQLDQFLGKEVTVRLYNHYGQTIWQKPLGEVQYPTERLNLEQFGPGTYLVELQSGSDRVTKKVVMVGM